MSSRPWSASTRRWPQRAEPRLSRPRRRRAARALGCTLLAVALGGCSSFRSHLSLPPPSASGGSAIGDDLAVAGVLARPLPSADLDRPGAPLAPTAVSPGEGEALARAVGRPLVRPALDAPELGLLMQPPAALAASAGALSRIRDRIGHRYAAIAARDALGLRHRTTWDVIVVLPTPWIIFFWDWPIAMSNPSIVPHDTASVRIVDLDRAVIVGESFLLRRGKAKGRPLDAGQLEEALEEIGWKAQ